jgi:NAD+ synthase (glutamine-hydrolysing)
MPSFHYRLVMAQLNPLVGDLDGNTRLITDAIRQAREQHNAQCIVFPELMLTGYPPEDLLHRPAFINACMDKIKDITGACQNITAIVGAPLIDDAGLLFNSAYVIKDGGIIGVAKKQCLPNYSVFDEERYFIAGDEACVIDLNENIRAGISICEDIWCEQPAAAMQEAGANLIININASPFHTDKYEQRTNTLLDRVNETSLPIIYVNQTGGQDELVFDGLSLAIDSVGEIKVKAPAFEDGLYLVEIKGQDQGPMQLSGHVIEQSSLDVLLYQALVYGVRDYVNKNGFSGAILGLSGGIDSALTLAIAVDALGADRVSAVMMPSQYTADMSLEDAQAEASALNIEYHVIPIAPAFEAFSGMLAGVFAGSKQDVTEENLQARSRGVVLMAISNKLGRIVLTTGNKSEMAVGYATLYGDMAGGFAPLKDVYKTKVYDLCRYRNTLGKVIPERVLTRPPTAELAPDQLDQDSLPSYDILDGILQQYIELDTAAVDIIQAGYDADQVADVLMKVDRNEYKRRQAPPGVKVTEKAFGRDRRYPITSGYGKTVN